MCFAFLVKDLKHKWGRNGAELAGQRRKQLCLMRAEVLVDGTTLFCQEFKGKKNPGFINPAFSSVKNTNFLGSPFSSELLLLLSVDIILLGIGNLISALLLLSQRWQVHGVP